MFIRLNKNTVGVYERFNKIVINNPYYNEPTIEASIERVYSNGSSVDLVQGNTKVSPAMENIPEIGFDGIPTGKIYSQTEVILMINSLAHAVQDYKEAVQSPIVSNYDYIPQ